MEHAHIGVNARMRQSLITSRIPMTSSSGEDTFRTSMIVPSLRTTDVGGSRSIVDAVPKNMMTRKARYVPVETAESSPERIVIASEMTEPTRDPD